MTRTREYTEIDRPACPTCNELAGGCEHPESETVYRQWRAVNLHDELVGALRDAAEVLVEHTETCLVDDCWETQTYKRVSAVLERVG
jgi:hypothetical protein